MLLHSGSYQLGKTKCQTTVTKTQHLFRGKVVPVMLPLFDMTPKQLEKRVRSVGSPLGAATRGDEECVVCNLNFSSYASMYLRWKLSSHCARWTEALSHAGSHKNTRFHRHVVYMLPSPGLGWSASIPREAHELAANHTRPNVNVEKSLDYAVTDYHWRSEWENVEKKNKINPA